MSSQSVDRKYIQPLSINNKKKLSKLIRNFNLNFPKINLAVVEGANSCLEAVKTLGDFEIKYVCVSENFINDFRNPQSENDFKNSHSAGKTNKPKSKIPIDMPDRKNPNDTICETQNSIKSQIEEILSIATKKGIPVYFVSESETEKIMKNSQGVVAVTEPFKKVYRGFSGVCNDLPAHECFLAHDNSSADDDIPTHEGFLAHDNSSADDDIPAHECFLAHDNSSAHDGFFAHDGTPTNNKHDSETTENNNEISNNDLKNYDSIIICENISDPFNAGTIIRLAHAFGFDAVFFTDNSVEAQNPIVVRASAGSIFRIDAVQAESVKNLINDLHACKFDVYSTALGENTVSLSEFIKNTETKNRIAQNKTAWIFGNEKRGVSKIAQSMSDRNIRIDMFADADSLNISVAAGICTYITSIIKNNVL